MRLAGCLIWLLAGTVDDAAPEPYAAVVTEETVARSGPGNEHYATSRLSAGARLEVFRESPGGWLGVRPPPGSFSWVPARQMKMTETDDLAVAAEDRVRVWIGTSLEQLNKHRWQVELRRHEAVELLGQRQLITPSGDVADTWYKISPPAGEFRWVHQSHVRRDDGTSPVATGSPAQSAARPAAPRPLPDSSDADRIGAPLVDSDGALAEPTEFQRMQEPAELQSVPAAWESWQPPRDTIQFDRQLRELMAALSLEVSRATSRWNLDELLYKVRKMAEQGPSALHRGKARKLLATVEQFETLRRRAAERGEVDGSTSEDGSGDGVQYDATGWLMPVHSTKRKAPPYAVLDDQGKFLQFVSPSPGLNLHRYEKQRVGLFGQSGYIPSLKMPHLTAQRVVRLK